MRNLFIGLLFVAALSACKSNDSKTTLPIFGTRQAVTKIVDGKSVTDTVYQTIPKFKFVNQYGDSISNKDLDGKIYVADFFFTTCPSICPQMARNMLKVYGTYKNSADLRILSHSIDPKHDSVPVLKKYADKLGVSGNTWWFLQGKKEDVYSIAEKNYLVAVKQDSSAAGGYVHQGYFVLVDQQKRVRGAYDGTDAKQVDQLIADIKTLQAEVSSKPVQ